MGSLKPDTQYIYERVDGVTYAREFGAAPNTRTAVGWDAQAKSVREITLENEMWMDIRREARSNPALQNVLDQAIMLYKLGKDYE
jgi:hypothetical protein